MVWVTKSASKLTSLLGKLHLSRSGSHDGATLYSVGSAGLATSGATVMLARSTAILDAALDRHAHHQGFDSAAYAKATTGVPANGLITAFGDLTPVLSTPNAAKARQVPWVAAITGYAASVSTSQNAMAIRFHVATGGKPLSVSQLPIASGTTSPGIAGNAADRRRDPRPRADHHLRDRRDPEDRARRSTTSTAARPRRSSSARASTSPRSPNS